MLEVISEFIGTDGLGTGLFPDVVRVVACFAIPLAIVAAVALRVRMPRLLAMPGAQRLGTGIACLEREVVERKAAERRITDLDACLERRVADPTASLAHGACAPATTATAGLPAAATAGARVLVVEDNAVNQLLVSRMLALGGHAVEVVRDGGEAIARVERGSYDLVLMDVHLPGIDGVTATRRIRGLPGAAAAIPIIALTANAMKGDRDGYLAAGMDDYVSKPIDARALHAAIARVLRGSGGDALSRDARIA